jgi:DNA-binding PadR family transcriptional regulator
MLQLVRMSFQTVRVLEALLSQPSLWRYGYDISSETSLKSGTLYPVLMRLHQRGWLDARWEPTEPGRPPRHLYRLTAEGLQAARAQLPVKNSRPQPRTVLGQEGN